MRVKICPETACWGWGSFYELKNPVQQAGHQETHANGGKFGQGGPTPLPHQALPLTQGRGGEGLSWAMSGMQLQQGLQGERAAGCPEGAWKGLHAARVGRGPPCPPRFLSCQAAQGPGGTELFPGAAPAQERLCFSPDRAHGRRRACGSVPAVPPTCTALTSSNCLDCHVHPNHRTPSSGDASQARMVRDGLPSSRAQWGEE